jgi:hypothetical protein
MQVAFSMNIIFLGPNNQDPVAVMWRHMLKFSFKNRTESSEISIIANKMAGY